MVLFFFLVFAVFNLGPDFGAPPSFMRKKLLTVLGECGKTSSVIDNISVVKRYASESSNAIPVSSDDEALTKAKKEVIFWIFPFENSRGRMGEICTVSSVTSFLSTGK